MREEIQRLGTTPTPKRRSSLKGRPGRPQVRRGVAELRLGKPLHQDVGKLRLDVANGGEQCFQTLFAIFSGCFGLRFSLLFGVDFLA